jgi:DNA-binding XRE family transcriptional regulator
MNMRSNELKALRVHADLSQADLAKAAGLQLSSFDAMEGGEVEIGKEDETALRCASNGGRDL